MKNTNEQEKEKSVSDIESQNVINERDLQKDLSDKDKPHAVSLLDAMSPVETVLDAVTKQIDRDFDFGR